MINELEIIGEQYGVSINVNKTEYLAVTKLETRAANSNSIFLPNLNSNCCIYNLI